MIKFLDVIVIMGDYFVALRRLFELKNVCTYIGAWKGNGNDHNYDTRSYKIIILSIPTCHTRKPENLFPLSYSNICNNSYANIRIAKIHLLLSCHVIIHQTICLRLEIKKKTSETSKFSRNSKYKAKAMKSQLKHLNVT